MAKRFGGLGDVSEVLVTANDMSGGSRPCLEDVKAAMEFLELGKAGR
ncbi:hypothetical protein [Microbulbifer sp. S227A]